jgi:hypothetical protein
LVSCEFVMTLLIVEAYCFNIVTTRYSSYMALTVHLLLDIEPIYIFQNMFSWISMHFLVVNEGFLHVQNAGFFSGKKRTVNGDDMIHKSWKYIPEDLVFWKQQRNWYLWRNIGKGEIVSTRDNVHLKFSSLNFFPAC